MVRKIQESDHASFSLYEEEQIRNGSATDTLQQNITEYEKAIHAHATQLENSNDILSEHDANITNAVHQKLVGITKFWRLKSRFKSVDFFLEKKVQKCLGGVLAPQMHIKNFRHNFDFLKILVVGQLWMCRLGANTH